jgi:putative drug exporter of the RND superfamily
MDRIYTALGRFAVRYRYLVVIAWIVMTFVCVRFFPSLTSVTPTPTLSSYLPARAPSVHALNLETPFQQTQYVPATLVTSRTDSPLTAADQAAIDRVEARVRAMPNVKLVRDLAVSQDGEARQSLIEADVPADGTGAGATLVDDIRTVFGKVDAPPGLTFHLTGQLATDVDLQRAYAATQNNTQNLIYLLIIVLLFASFRALLAPLLTIIPAALVLILASPVIGGAVTRFGVQASSLTLIVLIVLLLGAGTDYGLFLTFRVREELRRGLEPPAAVERAVLTVGETITFSALTVMGALSLLAFAQLPIYQGLGPSLAIGIALMLLAGLTLLPALLAIFGRATFWPSTTRQQETPATSIWGRLTGGLIQRPAVTLAAGIVIFGALAFGVLGTTLGGLTSGSTPPASADSTKGATVLSTHFPDSITNPTVLLLSFSQSIWTQTSKLATTQQQVLAIASVQSVFGPLNANGVPVTAAQLAQLHAILGPPQNLSAVPPSGTQIPPQLYNAYHATGQYISTDGQMVQFVAVLRGEATGPAAQSAIPGLRAAVAQAANAAGAVDNGVFSQNAFIYDLNQTSVSDLIHLIPLVVLLIGVLLALVLRSLIAPLYLVVSVVLSYLAAFGATALIFVHVAGQGALYLLIPFILFVFLMALGSDYNILVMRRIREEAQAKPLRQAVRDAIALTGGTVTTAGVILAGTFAVLAFTANNDNISQLGTSVALGILMDTFLIRTLLIPALVVLVGRWNWWPSSLSARKDVQGGRASASEMTSVG